MSSFMLWMAALAIWGISAGSVAAFAAESSCPRAHRPVPQVHEPRWQQNVAFCSRGGQTLRLDLARPAFASSAPVILFVHGGAWWEGSRDYYSYEVEQAARAGFVAATIDYRVSGYDPGGGIRNPFPAHLQDVRCAIRWIRANAVSLGVDSARVGIAGGSAGGHLSLLAALAPVPAEPSEPWAAYSSAVQAVVNFYGPTDLPALTHESPNLAPTVRAVFPDLWSASPIAYLRRESPPILTLHGSADDTVSFNQASRLEHRAREVGARHDLIRCEGEGHGFSPDSRRIANDHVFSFFARIFGHGVKRPSFRIHRRHKS